MYFLGETVVLNISLRTANDIFKTKIKPPSGIMGENAFEFHRISLSLALFPLLSPQMLWIVKERKIPSEHLLQHH